MKPILFEFFGIKIYSYGLMIGIGIISAIFLLTSRAKKKGYDEDSLFNLIIITVISGILGGKALYIITDFNYIKNNPTVIFSQFGYGFVIYGAIILGALAAIIYSKRKGWSILEIGDLLVPSLALAQGFGRIGCFLAGCCYGAETTSVLSVVFPAGGLAPAGIHLHPTQIYCSIFDFTLAFFLLWYDKKKSSKGKTFAMYLIIYSIGRFLVEFLRNDPRGSVGELSTSQFISIFILILGILIFNINKVKGRKEKIEG
ncbi:prolipoprotein diacylglyceryl transferase [Clostridium tarantellae]|uniref:Phosphatidylglycerol--prolipoprotein diacylglyceryl transferase n=1 Tax=Clostridium tarantellae TaxID=39493 RepID=A0A6I1MFT3_9CLOT|nr:prolipoprotein diacylglyceryl transferase [Clostridium tarantellae]MPQ42205.1 prolipoprotein diacylglyceryl transferase [Clostridium tarantellae]